MEVTLKAPPEMGAGEGVPQRTKIPVMDNPQALHKRDRFQGKRQRGNHKRRRECYRSQGAPWGVAPADESNSREHCEESASECQERVNDLPGAQISGAAEVGPAVETNFGPRRSRNQQAINIPARQQPVREGGDCDQGAVRFRTPFTLSPISSVCTRDVTKASSLTRARSLPNASLMYTR